MNQKQIKEKVNGAIRAQLERRGYVAPIDVLLEIGMLEKEKYQLWRSGKVDYLERVCRGNLHQLALVMHEIRSYAVQHDLKQSVTFYGAAGSKKKLRFSKSGSPQIEKWYATHFVDTVRIKKKVK